MQTVKWLIKASKRWGKSSPWLKNGYYIHQQCNNSTLTAKSEAETAIAFQLKWIPSDQRPLSHMLLYPGFIWGSCMCEFFPEMGECVSTYSLPAWSPGMWECVPAWYDPSMCEYTLSRGACVKGAESKGKERFFFQGGSTQTCIDLKKKDLHHQGNVCGDSRTGLQAGGGGGLRISLPSEERSLPSPALQASRRICWFLCCSLCATGTGHREVDVKPNTPGKGEGVASADDCASYLHSNLDENYIPWRDV